MAMVSSTKAGSLPLNDRAIAYFEGRGISLETVVHTGIYTAKRVRDGVEENGSPKWRIEPASDGNIIVFPFMEGGREVGAMYRARNADGSKRVWQRAGGKKTFWNSDVLDDPALYTGDHPLVITEGQPDAMTVIDCGHPWAVSVPDGAPQARDQNGNLIPMKPDEELDPEHDPKFSYIPSNWDRMKPIRRIILATDGDEPGERLRAELARRLGKSRCYFVTYPEEAVVEDDEAPGGRRACKDLNEVRVHFGAEWVRAIIRDAKPYPLSGLYRIGDYVEIQRKTFSTGWSQLDEIFLLYAGAFIVGSGLPGAGKSQFFLQLCFNMAWIHGKVGAICSLEADVKPDVVNAFRHFYIQRMQKEWTKEQIEEADAFIDRYFCFITRDPSGETDDDCTVPWLCDRIGDAVIRYGIDYALADPWNELDHKKEYGQARDEYINWALKTMKDCGKRNDVIMMIVAHPTKSAAESVKDGGPISLYDISDGAAWANKAEIGIIVHRDGPNDLHTKILTRKIKFRGTGKAGQERVLYFDDQTAQFLLG